MARRGLGMLAAAVLAAGCASPSGPSGHGPLVVVSAPLTSQPWVARSIERGARLAVEQLRSQRTPFRLEVLDNGSSPAQAEAVARRAVAEGAVALVTDGTGALAVAAVTGPASLPVFVVFDGGASFVDPKARPTVFRMAPADKPMATRLVDYLSSRARRVALVSDDSSYGTDGAAAVRTALRRNAIPLVSDQVLAAGSGDVAAQVLAARGARADTVLVWARARSVAGVLRAARSAGWAVPVYTGPTGEDPLVRQELADHPGWLDGTAFVSFRITSEQGPGPFAAFRAAFERRFGREEVGVVADGTPVVQPPDWATFPYDSVRLVAAALAADGGRGGAPLVAALESTVVAGANGDERGYGPDDREGVSQSDMYFARFRHERFTPVRDDLLSTNLPSVPQ